jgi:hypothetical protein
MMIEVVYVPKIFLVFKKVFKFLMMMVDVYVPKFFLVFLGVV